MHVDDLFSDAKEPTARRQPLAQDAREAIARTARLTSAGSAPGSDGLAAKVRAALDRLERDKSAPRACACPGADSDGRTELQDS